MSILSASACAWTVCLDPGHGGTDPGAVGDFYTEKEANLDVALEAASYLMLADNCQGFGLTRDGDYYVSLQDRCDYANAGGFDRFVSIHQNAYDGYVQGSETYCAQLSPSPGFYLASHLQDGLLWAYGYNDRGVKDGSWLYVIANTMMPAALGEGSFIDYDHQWNESWRYSTGWNDHAGRQGYACCQAVCLSIGSAAPDYGQQALIVDNLSFGFSTNDPGQWEWQEGGSPWGMDCRWTSTSDGDDWARWSPPLFGSGTWDVSVWYTQGPDRAPDAIYIVHHLEGDSLVTVDQTTGGGLWTYLGRYQMGPGSSVELVDSGATPERVVVADAARFQPVPAGVETEGQPPAKALDISVSVNPSRSFQLRLWLGEPAQVGLEVFDLCGRLVASTSSGPMPAGESGINWNPEGLPSGMYMVRAGALGRSAVCRVVLMR